MAWLPDGFSHPQRLDLPTGHHLRPIREADADIDYPAVMGSARAAWAKYGDAWGWPPADMSYEADRQDLARHEREIAAQETFNYAVLDEAETALLGCVYIDRPRTTRRRARTPSSRGGSSTTQWAPTWNARSASSSRAGSPRLGASGQCTSTPSASPPRERRGSSPSCGGSIVMLGSSRSSQPGMYQVFSPSQVKKAGTKVIFTTSASVKIETASTRPNSLLIRSDVRMNAAKTVPMMSAAATMTAIAAIPCSTASRRQPVDVLLPDAAHQEHHVVHEEPEEDRKGDGRHEGLDRAGLVQAHDVEQVALLEHVSTPNPMKAERMVVTAAVSETTIDRNAIAAR